MVRNKRKLNMNIFSPDASVRVMPLVPKEESVDEITSQK